jgi:hypothetical protein
MKSGYRFWYVVATALVLTISSSLADAAEKGIGDFPKLSAERDWHGI